MAAVLYPPSLPGPSAYPFAARERRVAPPVDGPLDLRARAREQLVDAKGVRWLYSPAEMAVWRDWYEATLLTGQRWFSVSLPGRGGWLMRSARYVSVATRQHRGAGLWEVSADLEVNASRAAPMLVEQSADGFGLLCHFESLAEDGKVVSAIGPDMTVGEVGALTTARQVFGASSGASTGAGFGATGITAPADLAAIFWRIEGWFYIPAGDGDYQYPFFAAGGASEPEISLGHFTLFNDSAFIQDLGSGGGRFGDYSKRAVPGQWNHVYMQQVPGSGTVQYGINGFQAAEQTLEFTGAFTAINVGGNCDELYFSFGGTPYGPTYTVPASAFSPPDPS